MRQRESLLTKSVHAQPPQRDRLVQFTELSLGLEVDKLRDPDTLDRRGLSLVRGGRVAAIAEGERRLSEGLRYSQRSTRHGGVVRFCGFAGG